MGFSCPCRSLQRHFPAQSQKEDCLHLTKIISQLLLGGASLGMRAINPTDFVVRGGQPVTQQQAFVPSPSPAGVRGLGITVCTQVLTPQLEEGGGG